MDKVRRKSLQQTLRSQCKVLYWILVRKDWTAAKERLGELYAIIVQAEQQHEQN